MCILFPFTLLNVFPAVLEMKMRVKKQICNLSIFMNDRTFFVAKYIFTRKVHKRSNEVLLEGGVLLFPSN